MFFICVFVNAQTRASSLYLSDVIKISLDRSIDIRTQQNEVNAKMKLADSTGTWLNPELSVERESKKDAADNETTSNKVGLSQTFSVWNKTSSQKNIALADQKIEENALEEAVLRTKISVIRLSYEYASDIEKARHVEERMRRFQDVLAFLKTRTFASPQKQTEASIVMSKMLVLKKELSKAKAEVDLTWNKLNYYLGLSEKADIKLNWLAKTTVVKESELLDKAKIRNFDIKRLVLESEKSEAERSFADKNTVPDFSITASMSDGSGFAREKTYSLGFSVPLPVFSKNTSIKEAQNYRFASAKLKQENYSEYLPSLVNTVFIKYQTAQAAVLDLPVSKIKELEKDFAKTDVGFKKGLVDLISYIEADSQHFEAINTIYDTQLEFIDALAEVTLVSGEFSIPVEKL